jgi:hypothetical protein
MMAAAQNRDVLHTAPCDCRVVRDRCGMHIEWCSLHGAAEETHRRMMAAYIINNELLADLTKLRRQIIEIAALAKARGEAE